LLCKYIVYIFRPRFPASFTKVIFLRNEILFISLYSSETFSSEWKDRYFLTITWTLLQVVSVWRMHKRVSTSFSWSNSVEKELKRDHPQTIFLVNYNQYKVICFIIINYLNQRGPTIFRRLPHLWQINIRQIFKTGVKCLNKSTNIIHN